MQLTGQGAVDCVQSWKRDDPSGPPNASLPDSPRSKPWSTFANDILDCIPLPVEHRS